MELCMNMHAEVSEYLPYSVNIIRKKSLHSSCKLNPRGLSSQINIKQVSIYIRLVVSLKWQYDRKQ